MRLLLEMNHEVRGDFVEETVEQVPRSSFLKFHFFIWSQDRLDRPKNLSCYLVLHNVGVTTIAQKKTTCKVLRVYLTSTAARNELNKISA
jgi:hypothetical protein